jgi:hypothetical protein
VLIGHCVAGNQETASNAFRGGKLFGRRTRSVWTPSNMEF